jgi:phosphoglycolate phosphatase-like HAD superfamily hydrolase
MKNKVLIVDLDDTLIATHYRQYNCINDYLKSVGNKFISYTAYFDLRSANNLSNKNLLKPMYPDMDWMQYDAFYAENIEAEKYLALDTLIVEKKYLTDFVKNGIKLILLSLRTNHINSVKQLQHLGLDTFFSEIYFVHHNTLINPKISKLDDLKRENSNIIAFCGDSIADYEAAQLLTINFVQVRTALYNLPDFEHAAHYNTINQYLINILSNHE